MLFKDRTEAGTQLAALMGKFKNAKNTIILGLPRGGVATAKALAKELNLPLDVTCPRKVGAPFNPELAIGAVTESGEGVYNWDLIRQVGISEEYLKQEAEKQSQIAQHRLKTFRKDLPPRKVEGKTVILVDDGLATGATMKAAIKSVRKENAAAIVVAVPVSPSDTLQDLQELADEVICIAAPPFFEAVGQFYLDFRQVEDDEVVMMLGSKP